MTNIKKVIMGDEARQGLLRGMETVAKTVGATAGAGGRLATISNQWGQPTLTKDGYKVSKAIELAGIEGEGVKLIQQASEKQNTEAGDGTTLVTTLTYEITKEGIKQARKGCNATSLKNGISSAAKDVVEQIKIFTRMITSNDEIKQVATISANGDSTIGELIANAVEKVGNKGVITVEDSKDFKTTLEIAEGIELENGYVSSYFMTNPEKQLVEFDKPLLFLSNLSITNIKTIVPLLEAIANTGRPVVFIVDDMGYDPLATLIMNHCKGVIKCCVVKAPSFGDLRENAMQDLAILTGATYISDKVGASLDNVNVDMLGTCDKIKITANKTVIIGGGGNKEDIQERILTLTADIANTDSKYDKKIFEERLANMTGGIAVIRAGGSSQSEISEKKDRIEDACCSTKSAIEEGIVPGGGVTLAKISQSLTELHKAQTFANANPDFIIGYNILLDAIKAQVKLLADNAGTSGEVILEKVLDSDNTNIGYDLISGKFVNMYEAGIVDATKCIRMAVETSASIAGSVLTTESVIIKDIDAEIKMNKLNPQMGGGQYM